MTGRASCVRPASRLAHNSKASTPLHQARAIRRECSASLPTHNPVQLRWQQPHPTSPEHVLRPDVAPINSNTPMLGSHVYPELPHVAPLSAQAPSTNSSTQQPRLAHATLHATSTMQSAQPMTSMQAQHSSNTRPSSTRRMYQSSTVRRSGMDCTCCVPGLRPLLALPHEKASASSPTTPERHASDQPDGAQQQPGQQDQQQEGHSNTEQGVKSKEVEDTSLPVRAALGMLGFYRNVLSPMMPSSCRYQPTCSNYSIESYKKFGVWRGSVLTAWRLLRCSPFGSSGYDPPMWPPPGLGLLYGEGAWEYGPQVTVVIGAVFLAWIANALWTEISYII